MFKVQPTRQKRLEKPQDDIIQWTLSNHYSKKPKHTLLQTGIQQQQQTQQEIEQEHKEQEYELQFANQFILLLDSVIQSEDKIRHLAERIIEAHGELLFSAKQFVTFILQQTPSITFELLELYYRLTRSVNSLALSLKVLLLEVKDIDLFSTELFSCQDDVIIKAYMDAMDKTTKEKFILQDIKQLVNWSSPLPKSISSRLLLLLQNDMTIPIQRFQYTLYLNGQETKDTNGKNDDDDAYLELLGRTKKKWLASKFDGSRHDLLLLYSQWFHEFNGDSQLRLIDHILNKVLLLDKEPEEEEEEEDVDDEENQQNQQQQQQQQQQQHQKKRQRYPDFYLILAIYSKGCQHLVQNGQDVIRIMDILDSLNNAVIKSLEGSTPLISLPFIIILAQLTMEYMHTSVGLNYAGWFESMFSDQKNSKLNKRTRTLLLDLLYKQIPYEIPAVLQIQAKVLASEHPDYLKLVKSRLLELGVDSKLKHYPTSITNPNKQEFREQHNSNNANMTSANAAAGDDVMVIVEKITSFIESKRVPFSLLEDAIFHARWYQKTFLPQLFEFKSNDEKMMKGRDDLIKALYEKKKISDAVYKDYLKKKNKSK